MKNDKLNLKYFKPKEFGEWWELMFPETLIALDAFRHFWGAPVHISPNPDALGRYLPTSKRTLHNVCLWGSCRAVDVFPVGMKTADDLKRAFECAKKAGFTGIGLYVDTQPCFMLHGDVRPDRTSKDPAKWSRVDGKYKKIEEAWECLSNQ